MTRPICNVFQIEVESCCNENILGAYQTCRLEIIKSQSQVIKNTPSDKSTYFSWFGGFCERSFRSPFFFFVLKIFSCDGGTLSDLSIICIILEILYFYQPILGNLPITFQLSMSSYV